MSLSHPFLTTLTCVILLSLGCLSAADLAQNGRDICAKSQPFLVSVTAVGKLVSESANIGNLGSQSKESSCLGVTVDASGLIVVPYSALNPMESMSRMLKQTAKTKAQLSDIRLWMSNGTSISARLVFKDEELDVACVMPDPKEGEKIPAFTSVTLESLPAVQVLDDVIVIARHNKTLGFQPIIRAEKIVSVITKPRNMYNLSKVDGSGAAVFLPTGQWLGLTSTPGPQSSEPFLIPAADVFAFAAQAKEAAKKMNSEGAP